MALLEILNNLTQTARRTGDTFRNVCGTQPGESGFRYHGLQWPVSKALTNSLSVCACVHVCLCVCLGVKRNVQKERFFLPPTFTKTISHHFIFEISVYDFV